MSKPIPDDILQEMLAPAMEEADGASDYVFGDIMVLCATSNANPEAMAGKLALFQLAQTYRGRKGYTCGNISKPRQEPSRSDAHNLRRKDSQESLQEPLRRESQQLSYTGHLVVFYLYSLGVLAMYSVVANLMEPFVLSSTL